LVDDQRTAADTAFPVRHHPAHPSPVEQHNRPTLVLVTVCTANRVAVLGNPQAHQALISAWHQAGAWIVGNYVVMPDHIHLFCTPAERGGHTIRDWVAFWKDRAGDGLPALRGMFQRDGWDTQMRTQGHYCRKLEYVRANPVRQGLVARAEDWPYQGRLNRLWW
jgi:putative transposase